MNKYDKTIIDAIMQRDPAARSRFEVYFTYSGFKALKRHRKAHWFYNHNMKFIARCISQRTKFLTGIEIHPGAKIGEGVFIDHGSGVVIGETAVVGNNVTIYQGVTLGGTGKDIGKRHPTIEDNVVISAGAKILGPFTVGHDSKIGAGSVVLKEVPPFCTVVGVPGRIVKMSGERVDDLNHIKLPDPALEEFRRLNDRLTALEEKHNIQNKRTITNDFEEKEN